MDADLGAGAGRAIAAGTYRARLSAPAARCARGSVTSIARVSADARRPARGAGGPDRAARCPAGGSRAPVRANRARVVLDARAVAGLDAEDCDCRKQTTSTMATGHFWLAYHPPAQLQAALAPPSVASHEQTRCGRYLQPPKAAMVETEDDEQG